MSVDQDEKQPPEASEASFGSGLGSDFRPLGKRVLIGPARNQRKLVVRIVREASSRPRSRKV